MNLKRIVFIVGPTAVGKSSVALYLAKKINGEIISCDSMQVYRDVSVANNKPSDEYLKKCPHHLIDLISVSKEFDAAIFCRKAKAAIKEVHQKGRIPIIVGGTGFYMTALLDGIFKGAAKDEMLRKRLENQARLNGAGFLYKKLKKIDPVAASRIHPNDIKRIIRAVEVFMLTKIPISKLQKNRNGIWEKFDIKIFALNRDRAELYSLINARVDQMFADGLIDEMKKISLKKWSRTAQGMIGFKELRGYFNGECSLEESKEMMRLHTRRYAKRQLTWFRRDRRLRWVMIKKNETPRAIAEKIILEIKEKKHNG
ncbi:MAG: tRNA (adenosine(37)-N6)-dimethylallyltransferase MiaA [Candidatus Omnitrophota bacterium]